MSTAPQAPASSAKLRSGAAWLGLACSTLSALLLGALWAGLLAFLEHGLDLGYATPLAFALLLCLGVIVHLAAIGAAVLALVLRARPLAWSIVVAVANGVSACALTRYL